MQLQEWAVGSRSACCWHSCSACIPSLPCRVTCGPKHFTCRQKCMELAYNPTEALVLPTPISCPYDREWCIGSRRGMRRNAGRRIGQRSGRHAWLARV